MVIRQPIKTRQKNSKIVPKNKHRYFPIESIILSLPLDETNKMGFL